MLIEPFTKEDLTEVSRLQPSDWNGVTQHYDYYLSHENCVPLKITVDDTIRAIGSVVFHENSAWLAHIITDKHFRGNGIGRKMAQALIEQIDDTIYSSIYLMSTELGYPIYKSLGFVEEGMHEFYLSDGKFVESKSHSNIRLVEKNEYQQIFELDAYTYGENRISRLEEKIETCKVFAKGNEIVGFYLPDLLEGPIISRNEESGKALMLERMKQNSVAIVPDTNIVAKELLKLNNWKVFRTARRMRLGKERVIHPEMIYNRFSGQIG